MDMNLVFRILGFGILIAVFSSYLKGLGRDDLAQMFTLAGLAVILMMVLQLVQELFQSIRMTFQF
ncbi:MAG: stage III sporulation protein AC [Firmicutes bacterium]|nr:stage III sporulation protein AC [Bacillota bacterium]